MSVGDKSIPSVSGFGTRSSFIGSSCLKGIRYRVINHDTHCQTAVYTCTPACITYIPHFVMDVICYKHKNKLVSAVKILFHF